MPSPSSATILFDNIVFRGAARGRRSSLSGAERLDRQVQIMKRDNAELLSASSPSSPPHLEARELLLRRSVCVGVNSCSQDSPSRSLFRTRRTLKRTVLDSGRH